MNSTNLSSIVVNAAKKMAEGGSADDHVPRVKPRVRTRPLVSGEPEPIAHLKRVDEARRRVIPDMIDNLPSAIDGTVRGLLAGSSIASAPGDIGDALHAFDLPAGPLANMPNGKQLYKDYVLPRPGGDDASSNIGFEVGNAAGVVALPKMIGSLGRGALNMYRKYIKPTSSLTPLATSGAAGTWAAGHSGSASGEGYAGGGAVRKLKGALSVLRDRFDPEARRALGIMKEPGGNWYPHSVDNNLNRLKDFSDDTLREMRADFNATGTDDMLPVRPGTLPHHEALNAWINKNLRNYITKDMATERDPVRALAEKGITHLSVPDDVSTPSPLAKHRMKVRKPQLGVASSPAAKHWEAESDASIGLERPMNRLHPDQYTGAPNNWKRRETENGYPLPDWVSKVPADAPIYTLGQNSLNNLGLPHLLDVLREDLESGALRPEQLPNMSVANVVQRAYEKDLAAKKAMLKAQAADMSLYPSVHEYPETGHKWIELARLPEGSPMPSSVRLIQDPHSASARYAAHGPDGKIIEGARDGYSAGLKAVDDDPHVAHLRGALLSEGNMMGHCVGGYCDHVLDKSSRIFTLRDKNGKPHVTVEMNPNLIDPAAFTGFSRYGRDGVDQKRMLEIIKEIEDEHKLTGGTHQDLSHWTQSILDNGEGLPRVAQIYGPRNQAPSEEVLPMVRDFIRKGGYRDVDGTALENARMYPAEQFNTPFRAAVEERYGKHHHYTKEELEALSPGSSSQFEHDINYIRQAGHPHWDPDGNGEGYARGGVVRDDDDEDEEAREKRYKTTRARILAGNARMPKRMAVGGMAISVENPHGTIRKDLHNDPPQWESLMPAHYGYIRGTKGHDKDHVDVFTHPATPPNWNGTVYVVNQKKANGHFDEHKAMVGFDDEEHATRHYLAAYEPGWESRIHSVVPMELDDFKKWAYSTQPSKGPAKGKEVQKFASGGLARAARLAKRMTGEPPSKVLNIVKEKGGNWAGSTVQPEIDKLKRSAGNPEQVGALNQWLDRNLKNYVTRDMGTPEDPVRALAERGIPVVPGVDLERRYGVPRKGESYTTTAPGRRQAEITAEHPAARVWEQVSDASIGSLKATEDLIQRNLNARVDVPKYMKAWTPQERIGALVHRNMLKYEDLLRRGATQGNRALLPELEHTIPPELMSRRTPSLTREEARYIADQTLSNPEHLNAIINLNAPRNGNRSVEITRAQAVALKRFYEHAVTQPDTRYVGPRFQNAMSGKGARIDPFAETVTPEQVHAETLKAEPWLAREGAPEARDIYALNRNFPRLGFDHVADVLRHEMQLGLLRPDQLKNISVADAKLRTHQYDQRMAADIEKAKLVKDIEKLNRGAEEYKMYEDGFKWHRLHDPESLNAEGRHMGHCVGSYCSRVQEGGTHIYSLRDAEGAPHVTIEARPGKQKSALDIWLNRDADGNLLSSEENARRTNLFERWYGPYIQEKGPRGVRDPRDTSAVDADFFASIGEEPPIVPPAPVEIVQIKGKQNRAPVEQYQKYVQDFLRSHPNLGEVRELNNAGLLDMNDAHVVADRIRNGMHPVGSPEHQEFVRTLGVDGRDARTAAYNRAADVGYKRPHERFMTRQELEDMIQQHMEPLEPPPETPEFAHGGLVGLFTRAAHHHAALADQ